MNFTTLGSWRWFLQLCIVCLCFSYWSDSL